MPVFMYSATVEEVLYMVTVLLEYLSDCFIRVSQIFACIFLWKEVRKKRSAPCAPLPTRSATAIPCSILFLK